MKIDAVFTDYDGTIAPLNIERSKSRVYPEISKILSKIAERSFVCIITSKDYHFIRRRTSFAHAWSCVSGLDTYIRDGRYFTCREKSAVREIELLARKLLAGIGIVERKLSKDGRLLGLSVEWKSSKRPEVIEELVMLARNKHVYFYEERSFIDFYSEMPSKGRALLLLKRELGIKGKVVYMGDSRMDKQALKLADISVFVKNSGAKEISSTLAVSKDGLARFLSLLYKKDMEISMRDLRSIESC